MPIYVYGFCGYMQSLSWTQKLHLAWDINRSTDKVTDGPLHIQGKIILDTEREKLIKL